MQWIGKENVRPNVGDTCQTLCVRAFSTMTVWIGQVDMIKQSLFVVFLQTFSIRL